MVTAGRSLKGAAASGLSKLDLAGARATFYATDEASRQNWAGSCYSLKLAAEHEGGEPEEQGLCLCHALDSSRDTIFFHINERGTSLKEIGPHLNCSLINGGRNREMGKICCGGVFVGA